MLSGVFTFLHQYTKLLAVFAFFFGAYILIQEQTPLVVVPLF